jgi:protein XagA
MKKIVLTIGFLCVTFITIYAQGWSQKKGEGYFKLGFNAISSSSFYGPDGTKTSITTTGIYSTSLYAEYGLTDRLTAITYAPFFVRNTLNGIQYRQSGRTEPGDVQNSFGDTDIALKYGWVRNKPFVFSTTLLFGLPTGNNTGGKSGILQSGDGEFNQMIRGDFSHSFYPIPLFASVYSAYNNRTNNFSDEFRYGFDMGYTLGQWSGFLHLNAVKSLKNGGVVNTNNGVFSNNMEFISPGAEVAYQFKNGLGVSVSYLTALSGKNILAASSLGGGIIYSLKKNR